MKKDILCLTCLLAAFFAFSAASLWAQKAETHKSKVGQVTVTMTPPEGMVRVDGRNARADAFVKAVEPKFKFKVLAIYADKKEWDAFVEAASKKQPASIPRYAMIGVPRKMHKKSFDTAKARKELKSNANWFNLAANNSVTASLLTSQGNKKLKEYMGVDIGFKFKTDKFTQVFEETSSSASAGARVDFKLHGQPSEVYLTVTPMRVGDKFIYLAYFEKSGTAEQLRAVQAKTGTWRRAVNSLNAGN